MSSSPQAHWDSIYARRALTEVSWFQAHPAKSLELIRASGVQVSDPIIDVGGGASFLVDALLSQGYRDLTVLDVSSEALSNLRNRLGPLAHRVALVQADVTAFRSERRYALWHDRAVFHFLVRQEDRNRYLKVLRDSLDSRGHLILATFGPQGPERCSGLPVARYDASSLSDMVGADFALVESSLEMHITPSRDSQQFLYCRFRRAPQGVHGEHAIRAE